MSRSALPVLSTQEERKARAQKILKYLKRAYPVPKTELNYSTPFQLVVAVMLSAQCTDKKVNEVTKTLYTKYKKPKDFAEASLEEFTKEIGSITFNRAKARHVIGAAKVVEELFNGKVPKISARDHG